MSHDERRLGEENSGQDTDRARRIPTGTVLVDFLDDTLGSETDDEGTSFDCVAAGARTQVSFFECKAALATAREALATSEQNRAFETEALKAEINHLRRQNALLQEELAASNILLESHGILQMHEELEA